MFNKITKFATLVPVCAAIFFTCRGFIGLGMTFELVAILTLLMASLSWLLSQALLRFLEIRSHPWMAGSVILLGLAFLVAETFFAHLGLEWMLHQGDGIDAHPLVIWFFSGAISVANVLMKWTYLHAPGNDQAQPATSARAKVVKQPIAHDDTVIADLAAIRDKVLAA